MPTDFEEMKKQLLASNDEFRQLATQHHDLDERWRTFCGTTAARSRATRRRATETNLRTRFEAGPPRRPAFFYVSLYLCLMSALSLRTD
jgi:hypothetical protein